MCEMYKQTLTFSVIGNIIKITNLYTTWIQLKLKYITSKYITSKNTNTINNYQFYSYAITHNSIPSVFFLTPNWFQVVI